MKVATRRAESVEKAGKKGHAFPMEGKVPAERKTYQNTSEKLRGNQVGQE